MRAMYGSEKCPHCGQPMERGTLGTMSYVAGAAWYKERSALALHGETIVKAPLGGMIWLEGHRYAPCHMLQLRY
jgi:hypothetical protein